MNQYDKLGDLLREAIDNPENLKRKKTKKKPDENKIENEILEKLWEEKDLKWLSKLNLDKNASLEQVKSSYRKLLKKYHPDNIPNYPEMQKTAAEKTRIIVEAYRNLIKE
ncbi:MAG: DnaJ domain-containing protein [Treponema sp.]|nr:DnaJ domain-containing protein [Treponema sp.]